jgi:ubiquitin-protein ligase
MALAIKRILIDILDLKRDPLPDTFLYFNESNIHEIWVGIVGQSQTPYDGGFFFFHVQFTNRYPAESPKVWFITPEPSIRFNPNLYETGKVCMSILGTWTGPEWTSVMNLTNTHFVMNQAWN